MPTYKIRGIDVDFPYEAYDCQIVYMEKVIQSLQNKCNALLESPTGTGKTLCLLCATLAWRRSLGPFSIGKSAAKEASLSQSTTPKLPPIVYTSRTHSQIRQVIQELKRTTYRPKMVVLGSREQLCIHDEVSELRGKAQTNACQFVCRKRKKKRCSHYPRVAEFLKNNPALGDEPIDIEDLVNIGRSSGPCPYYLSKELHKVVDILFAPYNYLIERGYRKSLSLEWNNSILIFDEAHNLESICADAASFDLPAALLTASISEVTRCIALSIARRDKSNDKSSNPDSFSLLRALLLKLEKQIAEVHIESKEFGFTKPGPYIYQLLADLNINYDTATKLIDIIEAGLLLLQEDASSDGRVNQKISGNTLKLESLCDIFRIIFQDSTNAHANFYRVHMQDVEGHAKDFLKGKTSRTLSWWCFNPGLAMEEFSKLGVGSIILTSGTLSPMDSFAQELRIDFPVRLENPHVISPNQIWAGVVSAGPSGCLMNSSYRHRESSEYKRELGNAIVNFARIVPDGLLVFFPSYYLLEQCIGCWKDESHGNSARSSSIWDRISRHKQPVVEPRQSSLFLSSIDEYMAKLRDTSTSGAIFFAVCRGKVSEGLDFADQAGRAVIVTGMPFATWTDPKVRLKREYLDQQAQTQMSGSKAMTGEEWYSQQATRAVNQAVGRVIRHRHDYGAIIFCDERFAYSNRQSQISLWIRPHIQCYSTFGDIVFSLTRFFRDGGARSLRKPEITQTVHGENSIETTEAQDLDKFYLEKFVTPTNTPKDQDSSMQSLSSLLEVKRGSISNQLVEVLPANRSSLTSLKTNQAFTLKSPNSRLYNEKKLTSGRKDNPSQNPYVVDLTSDEELSKEVLASCSGKRRKLLIGVADSGQPSKTHEYSSGPHKANYNHHSLTADSIEHEKSQRSSSKQNYETAQRSEAKVLDQENNDVQSPTVTTGGDETRGSAFLIQVREKLSAAEYIDFVEFMKALKSKAMKLGHVLQSIARLFSGPERLLLRKRFKDYIPAKHHSLYEKYFESNEEGAVELITLNHQRSSTNSMDSYTWQRSCLFSMESD